jgi:two-component system, OmpR family, sensor kinase
VREHAPRLRLSLKIGLALFLVVVGALGIVYLAVVPQLESRLVNAKIRELERSAPSVVAQVERADPFRGYPNLVSFFGSSLNARVVIFDRLNESALLPLADSSGLRSQDVQRDPVALESARTGLRASGRVTRGDHDFAEVAVPAGPTRIVLLSASLRDALANVNLVQRSLLLSGLAALLVSWAAGYIAAWRFSRRIRRLERAADRIAGGDFDVPVVDSGRDEVGQLAGAFDSMRVRLSRLEHARREFIANASHELRTPLFSLGGFLELLTDEDVDENTRREFLLEMRGQVERLTKLATDLLDLTRLDAGQLSVERVEVDLAAVARTVCEEFRVVAEASAHEVLAVANGPAQALGDEQRVLQIARALVENAIRHTPEGTKIEVGAGPRDENAFLSVRDDGPGIAASEQQHLFDRFYRADGGKAFGSGLGLAIASELAARMDGRLEVQSEPGMTVFTLLLPGIGPSETIPREIGVAKDIAAPR